MDICITIRNGLDAEHMFKTFPYFRALYHLAELTHALNATSFP